MGSSGWKELGVTITEPGITKWNQVELEGKQCYPGRELCCEGKYPKGNEKGTKGTKM
jgi:hypothetical protein